MSIEDIVLDETIHQPTRLRMMTMLVAQPEDGRLAYGFIQRTLPLPEATRRRICASWRTPVS